MLFLFIFLFIFIWSQVIIFCQLFSFFTLLLQFMLHPMDEYQNGRVIVYVVKYKLD